MPGSATSLAVDHDTGFLYIADSTAGTVTIVSTYNDELTIWDTIHTGPGYVSVTGMGQFAVANPEAGTVTIIQLD